MRTESSSFRKSVLTGLRNRGVEDILITVTDNLNGFTDTVRAVFLQPGYLAMRCASEP
ncbi:MAG: transposase [Prevotellaceae bacterium]|nr:transposase [Prevotellaceae bacterium]